MHKFNSEILLKILKNTNKYVFIKNRELILLIILCDKGNHKINE